MSLQFGEDHDPSEDPAQIEIAGLMDARRAALHRQMVADGVQNELCNAVLEHRGKLGITQRRLNKFRDSSRGKDQKLFDYIRKLESFQSVFWCPKCHEMNSVAEKPADFSDTPVVGRSPAPNAALPTPVVAPRPVISDSVLDNDIPDYLSMQEITTILRALQSEVRALRDKDAASMSTQYADLTNPGDWQTDAPDGYFGHDLSAGDLLSS